MKNVVAVERSANFFAANEEDGCNERLMALVERS